jgi:hypothetical protein
MRRALGAFAALLAAVGLAVYAWARMPQVAPLAPARRAELVRALRAVVDTGAAPTLASAKEALRGVGAPAIVSLYDGGAAALRVVLDGDAAPLADAARAVAADVRTRGRIKVDLVQARAPLATRLALALAFGVEPGVDGAGVTLDGRDVFLTADDLVAAELFGAQPLPPTEVRAGLDGRALFGRLAHAAGVSAAEWTRARKSFFRFRGDSFVESAAHDATLAAERGHAVREVAPTAANLLAAAVAGGRYLVAHEHDGRFGYEYYTLHDQEAPLGADYSLPRHAGGAWFLAQLYARAHDVAFEAGARAALDLLATQTPPGCDGALACVGAPDAQRVETGAAAMALVAVSEYLAATRAHDATDVEAARARFAAWGARLAAFVRAMQRDDGGFCHFYAPATRTRDERTQVLYASGEATYALARWAAVVADDPLGPAHAHAADDVRIARAIDALTHEYDRHFAGQFYFGEDHWTCLAGDVAWPRLDGAARARVARFCGDFAAFLRRGQFAPDEAITRAHADFRGGYGFTPLAPPHHTPAASRTEAAISAWTMRRALGGRPDANGGANEDRALRAQIDAGVRYLLRHQLTSDDGWLMPNPTAASGGFLMSDVDRHVRIDFVQHACSALLRAAEML